MPAGELLSLPANLDMFHALCIPDPSGRMYHMQIV